MPLGYEYAHKRWQCRARHVVDLRPTYDDYVPHLTSRQRRDVADSMRLPGGLRKSGHRGRIISVR